MGEHSKTKSEEKTEEVHKPSRATQLFIVWRNLKKSKLAVAGTVIVFSIVLLAALAPILPIYSLQFRGRVTSPPSLNHVFGTDAIGRDMLSLVIHGASISLYVALGAVSIELLIGVPTGMIAGYFGGKLDEVLMRITDVFLSLPTLPLLILAVSMFEVRGIHIIMLVMGMLGWTEMARYVRSEFLTLRETTFVEAAKSMGASSWRVTLRHILPNTLSTIIVLVTMDIPWYIFYEATLSFLGFGDPSAPSWGILLERGYGYLSPQGWWMITFPGLAIFFTSLGFNLLGDGLRDALDVKSRGR
jgi:peptide/nickel transport system permease protein